MSVSICALFNDYIFDKTNDIKYDESTGLYTLQTTMTSKVGNWSTDKNTISGYNGFHYTCLNESGICSSVMYISYVSIIYPRSTGTIKYIELSNGKNITDDIDFIIYTAAIKEDNPELQNAITLGIPTIKAL